MDAVKNQVNNKLNKGSQPGNGVEASADNNVNQGTYFPSRLSALPKPVTDDQPQVSTRPLATLVSPSRPTAPSTRRSTARSTRRFLVETRLGMMDTKNRF